VKQAVSSVALIEGGKVLLPMAAGWLDDFLDEVTTVPASRHGDWTDTRGARA